MKKKLAIFDLDGTLFDTNDVNYRAYRDALEPFGKELDREYYVKYCKGRHYTDFLPVIMGSEEHMEEVHALKKKYYSGNLKYARENKHLFAMAEMMKPEYRLAVVTTASRKNTEEILRHFGYLDLFDLLLTQEDIKKRKPDPDGFLQAMRHFGNGPEDTVIFEDSDVGLQAAVASGAAVFKAERF